MIRAISAIGLFLAVATVCIAQEVPGEQFTQPLGFALIRTTVVDVQRIFGPATVTEEGHHERVVCYIWPDSNAVVTFMSQGEHLFGRFTMRKYNGEPPVGCPKIPHSAI